MQCSVNQHHPPISSSSSLDNLLFPTNLFLATLWNLKASPSIQHRPISRRHPTRNTPVDSIRTKRQPWTRPTRTIIRVRWILPAAWRRIIRPVPMPPSTRPKANWRRVNNRWKTSLPSPNDFWNNTVSHLMFLMRDEREANSISANISDLDTSQWGCVSSRCSTGELRGTDCRRIYRDLISSFHVPDSICMSLTSFLFQGIKHVWALCKCKRNSKKWCRNKVKRASERANVSFYLSLSL